MRPKFIFGLVLILLISHPLLAQEEGVLEQAPQPKLGLSVQPGGLLIQYIKLGEKYDLHEKTGISLIIENKDERAHTYRIFAGKPSVLGNKKWLQGYSQIPDPSWFWFERNEVTIEAQSKEEIKMYLKIPQEEQYLNQHWTIALGVAGKPEAGAMLSLAVYPRYQIETVSEAEIKGKPAGITAVSPSTVEFEDVILGKRYNSTINLYNNDEVVHHYKIKSKRFKVNPMREQIVPSAGYSWIPKAKWIKIKKRRAKIDADGVMEIPLEIKIPKGKENFNRKWEAVLWIEPKEGAPHFARVKIKTKASEEYEN